MDKEKQSTKEKILETSLDMFSTRGYSAVSIRDISKSIGIKESSIYYHFINKQDIFDGLINMIHQVIQNLRVAFIDKLVVAEAVEENDFVESSIRYITDFLLEKQVFKIINMLSIEKYTNAVARKTYHELMFEIPLLHQEAVFLALTKKKILKECNIKDVAMEYQSIVLFVFFNNFLSNEYTKEDEKRAIEEMRVLMKQFYMRYFVTDSNFEKIDPNSNVEKIG